MSKITHAEVLKLARLARLSLSHEEVQKYTEELAEILGYVEMLSKVDTSGLAPTNQVTGLHNVFRPDTVVEYQAKPDKLLALLPKQKDDYIQVKRMI
jgi:aspartyl-tRNA(Asn)/glutamyl-tRNA(Gln) amidotransferase subunit C